MTSRKPYAPIPANTAQFSDLWSAHVNVLERHLSINTWTLKAVPVVVIVYPIARIVVPAILHAVVQDVVRSVLNLI
jgi:hypothetical protein